MKNKITYNNSFNLFTKRTNEKKIILKIINREIKLNKKMYFLDIGGGNGLLTIPISKKVNKTLVIEPNKHFSKIFLKNGVSCLNDKWEKIKINQKFDFILAAYCITHFSQQNIEFLVKKMINNLEDGGKLIILAVDEKKGSWRGVHTYFYKTIGIERRSSTSKLKKIIKKLHGKKTKIMTEVKANDIKEMVDILSFDFSKFGGQFENNKAKLENYLKKYIKNEKVVLKMVHWMFVISK